MSATGIAERRAPILVTGSHRSGTTWVGELLASARGVAHVHEPLNPANRLSWLGRPPDRPFEYIDSTDDRGYGPAFDRIVELRPPLARQLRSVRSPRHLAANVREGSRSIRWRIDRARALVKDPLAVMSAEWFAHRYAADVVVMVRHPAAFAGSLKRQGWQFDFEHFRSQPGLMERHLAPFAEEVERAAAEPPDIIGQAVLLWRCINHTVSTYAAEHPEWTVRRFEDLASEPIVGAQTLYARTGLVWDERADERVRSLSSEENPAEVDRRRTRDVRRDSAGAMWTWTERLEPNEIERIRAGTADVAGRFYGPEDWEAPGASASSRSSSST